MEPRLQPVVPTELGGSAAELPNGLGVKPLAVNLAVQGMYMAIAALGISVLLQPFGGPSVPHLLVGGRAALPGAVAEAALGVGVAALVLTANGVPIGGGAADGQEACATLAYTPAQVQQMRPLFEIVGGEGALPRAAAALAAWQLSIALAEELYYRGFVQSAGILLLTSLARPDGVLSPAGVACEALPLCASSALFGLVHTEFVEAAPPEVGASLDGGAAPVDSKGDWFRVTASYGALYGLLYAVSGHHVVAPAFAHAGINLGICMRDWRRLRRTPEVELRETFGTAQ
jgi:membrane protease YdiL (CAAX protease family)